MIFKRTLALLLTLALCLCLLGAVSASADSGAGVVFKATAPDTGGVFKVTMTISNATFNVFQFALRFDPAVIRPVDPTGTAASDFFDCTEVDAKWLSTVGCSVDAATGFLGFTGYISPGESDPLITNGEAVLGADGAAVFTFRFKQLKTGDPALRVATKEQGEPYEHAFPEGAGIMGRAGETPAAITFDMTALEGGGSTGGSITPQPQEPVWTAESLLKACLILKIDSRAVVVNKAVTTFYAGEPDVVPYIDANNRTMVPLRFVAERLGAEVGWLQDTQTAVIEKDATRIELSIGESYYTVNGVRHEMDTAAVLMKATETHSRTMVPIRFVAEALGNTVGWDADNRFVVIAPGEYDWKPDGALEKEVLSEAKMLLVMYGGFV